MTDAKKEIKRLHSVLREREQERVSLKIALTNLVEACGHVNIGALNGTTVKDFRNVMKFMAACDAAKELVGEG